jgi:hypothetical protein
MVMIANITTAEKNILSEDDELEDGPIEEKINS